MARGVGTHQTRHRGNVIRKTSIAVIIVSLLVFVLGLNGRQPVGAVRAPAEGLASRILTITSMPIRGAENISTSASRHFDLAAQNDKLRTENNRLRQIENQNLSLSEQVNYLEGILNTNINPKQSQRIAARAVSESRGPFVNSALINAGLKKGVREGNAVMSLNGLYGRVVRAGNSSARVLLLTDLNSRVAVMSQRSRSRAILTGNNSRIPSLEFRSAGADWKYGDRIVTSGDGGVLPRGLPVGVARAGDGSLEVALFTDKQPVDWIWVVPHLPVPAPEENLPNPETESSSGETP
ncbi:MAG: rod shape-determining protein MreC [Robiginitomaculum sp.]